MLDQAVRLGLSHAAGGDHPAVGVELELRLERLDLERAHRPALGQERSRAPGERQRLGDLGRRLRAAGEDLVELLVVEPGVRADPASIEARGPRRAGRVETDLGGDRQPVHPRDEAACLVRERPRQHGLHRSRDVDAGRPAPGLGVKRAARPHVSRHVRDMDPQAHSVAVGLGRDGIVEVARGGRVHRERPQLAEVTAGGVDLGRAGDRLACVVLQASPKSAPLEALPQQRVDHVARAFRRAEHARDAQPARPRLCQDHLAWLRVEFAARDG